MPQRCPPILQKITDSHFQTSPCHCQHPRRTAGRRLLNYRSKAFQVVMDFTAPILASTSPLARGARSSRPRLDPRPASAGQHALLAFAGAPSPDGRRSHPTF
eukprot:8897041-Pyramimonas_sp.AAC.1